MSAPEQSSDHKAQPIDLAKLSLLQLVHRVQVGQLVAVVASIIGMSLTAGYQLAALSTKAALSDQKAELVESCRKRTSDAEQKIGELTATSARQSTSTRELCGKLVEEAQKSCTDKVADLNSRTAESNVKLARCISDLKALSLKDLRAQESGNVHKDGQALVQRLQTDLTTCNNEVGALRIKQCFSIDSYYVNAQIRKTNLNECLAGALEAATKVNAIGKRVEDEVQLTTNDGYRCAMYCGEIKVITCNGPLYSASRVLSDRLTRYLGDK